MELWVIEDKNVQGFLAYVCLAESKEDAIEKVCEFVDPSVKKILAAGKLRIYHADQEVLVLSWFE